MPTRTSDTIVPGGSLMQCTVMSGTRLASVLVCRRGRGRVAETRSRDADRLFADDDEPSGWYVVVEKLRLSHHLVRVSLTSALSSQGTERVVDHLRDSHTGRDPQTLIRSSSALVTKTR